MENKEQNDKLVQTSSIQNPIIIIKNENSKEETEQDQIVGQELLKFIK